MNQVTIDLMAELNKFGAHITQIRDAIQAKGVTSEGKLFKFAEEISKIQNTNSAYAGIISYVEEAYRKGYYEYEIVDMLRNLKDRNAPLPTPNPAPSEEFDKENATEIPARQFYGRSDLEGLLECPNVVKVGAEAFIGINYNIVKLPKATEIDKKAFRYSNIKVLYIPNFVWKDDNLDLSNDNYPKYMLNKIVVADESIPPSDIGIYKVDFEVYNHDETKKWNIYSNVWEAV